MVYMVVIVYTRSILVSYQSMKAYKLLNSPETWCQSSPARDRQGNKLQAFDPRAAQWCALGAIQKSYPPTSWAAAMDRVLSALSYSDAGLAQMTPNDKACSLMEWNNNHQASFQVFREF